MSTRSTRVVGLAEVMTASHGKPETGQLGVSLSAASVSSQQEQRSQHEHDSAASRCENRLTTAEAQ
jgi:hypothetical protein